MPEDPKVAETYYSQFDEFEDDKDTSRDTSHDSSGADVESIHGHQINDVVSAESESSTGVLIPEKSYTREPATGPPLNFEYKYFKPPIFPIQIC